MKKKISTLVHSTRWVKRSSILKDLMTDAMKAVGAMALPILLVMLWSNNSVAQCALACNDHINISVDLDCEALITPDMVVEGFEELDCTGLTVEIQDENMNPIPSSPLVNSDHIGRTLIVSVVSGNNSCWGYITVEDKVDPEITCPAPSDIYCYELEDALNGSLNTPQPVATDACDVVTTSYEDSVADGGDCGVTVITRTWTATDGSGNTASCDQIINVINPTLDDVDVPDDITLECGAATSPDDLDGLISEGPADEDYPSVNGNDINETLCNLGASYTDQTIDICTGSYKLLRTWSLVDWCTGEIRVAQQIIKVLDQTAPIIECPENMHAGTDQYTCTATIILPQPTLSDACGSVTYTAESTAGTIISNGPGSYILTDVAPGDYTVTYYAEDDCGNTAECFFYIWVKDNVPPIAVCDEHTEVSLGIDGTARVFASTFDDGSHDNCGEVFFKVLRMETGECNRLNGDDNPANSSYQEWFDDYADFCCDDIADSPITVIFRVYDVDPGEGPVSDNRHNEGGSLYGHYNDCMVEVNIEDKIGPSITCPPDVTISCEFDYSDLSVFGTVQTDEDDRQDVTTVDPNGLGTTTWGQDGIAYDNCDVTVSESSNENIECGNGLITRVFTATDPNGLTASCVQRIRVINYDPFDGNDIVWPTDKDADCAQGINTDATGEPGINDDHCDNVFVGYDDLELPVEYPFCYKILRTWVVIDWCQYDPNGNQSVGRWENTQVIKVLDTTAPEITVPGDVTVDSDADNCSNGNVELDPATGSDDCSSITITNDYNNGGADASGTYPYGTTIVTFTIEDGCGNITTEETSVTVTDGKKPTPVCQIIATTIMPSAGAIEIWASDFEAGSSFDNCTAYEDLDFRVRRVQQFDAPNNNVPSASQTSVTFDCNDLGQQWVDLWVGDESGNWDHCRTYIVIQDPSGSCGGGDPTVAIAGRIANEMDDEVNDVEVQIAGDNGFEPFMTGLDGAYTSEVSMHNNYTVTPQKNIDPLNGVTTFDIVMISKHILGVQALNSPYKMIAADINNSGSVTTLDLVELRKLILHIDTEFSNNTSWRFVDKNFVFPNASNPFATSFPEVISFNDLDQDVLEANFTAIKVGDVNDSAIANNILGVEGRTTAGNLVFNATDAQLKAGDTYTVEFTAQDAVLGYQFTMNFDQKALELVEVSNEENFGLSLLNEGVITSSWNNVTATKAGFSLTFKALNNVTLSNALTINSKYTAAEAYNADAEVLDVALAFNGQVAANSFELYQNTPNPFKSETAIGFNLPEAGSATLTIYDLSGKVLKQFAGDYAKGYNEISINRNEVAGAGVLYYQLDTNNDSATKKMLLID